MKKHKESEKRAVKRTSPVYKLDPVLGEDGLAEGRREVRPPISIA